MLTWEIKELDSTFKTLVKRRRGTMLRRGGAGSRDFEMSFEFRGLEVLCGIESGWIADDAMFLFVRHGKSAEVRERVNPFMPPPPDTDMSPIEPDLVAKALRGGRRGAAGTATPSAPAGDETALVEAPPPRPVPGFSIRVRPMEVRERLYRFLTGRSVWKDAHRPGWFHVDMQPGEDVRVLPEGLREPMRELLTAGPPITKLSVAMTSLFFRIRRAPFPLDVDGIDHFINASMMLFRSALDAPPDAPAAPDPGLQIFEVLLLEGGKSRCGVCGEDTVVRRVKCAKCDTPHHEECWRYGGGCSVFACGSTVNVEC